MNKTQQQIIALAGLFQSMSAVNDIAKTGNCDTHNLETAIKSLFNTNPETTISVYGELNSLKKGLEICLALLEKADQGDLRYIVRYALAILHLERKLNKTPEMLSEIGNRLNRANAQLEHFDITHENVIKNLASTYLDTISTFQLRLQISGHERYLSVDLNAAKIRTLLLSGIRAAMLWRQLGGHRWHFIFKRSASIRACKELLQQIQ